MCPISCNIYRMKLNEGHFSFGIVIIHFWDKTYQEIHLKSQLNSVLLFNFILLYMLLLTSAYNWMISIIKFFETFYYFVTNEKWCQIWKCQNVPWNNVRFCFVYIVWVHLRHKHENFRFWKSLKYYNIFW